MTGWRAVRGEAGADLPLSIQASALQRPAHRLHLDHVFLPPSVLRESRSLCPRARREVSERASERLCPSSQHLTPVALPISQTGSRTGRMTLTSSSVRSPLPFLLAISLTLGSRTQAPPPSTSKKTPAFRRKAPFRVLSSDDEQQQESSSKRRKGQSQSRAHRPAPLTSHFFRSRHREHVR